MLPFNINDKLLVLDNILSSLGFYNQLIHIIFNAVSTEDNDFVKVECLLDAVNVDMSKSVHS